MGEADEGIFDKERFAAHPERLALSRAVDAEENLGFMGWLQHLLW
jgi:hypothetical protein